MSEESVWRVSKHLNCELDYAAAWSYLYWKEKKPPQKFQIEAIKDSFYLIKKIYTKG